MTGDHTGGHGAMFTLSPPLSVISDVIIVMLWVNIGDILIHHEQVPPYPLCSQSYRRKIIDKKMSLMRLTPGNMLSVIMI